MKAQDQNYSENIRYEDLFSLGFDLPQHKGETREWQESSIGRYQMDTEELEEENIFHWWWTTPREKETDKMQGYSWARTSTPIISPNRGSYHQWMPDSHWIYQTGKLFLYPREKWQGRGRNQKHLFSYCSVLGNGGWNTISFMTMWGIVIGWSWVAKGFPLIK